MANIIKIPCGQNQGQNLLPFSDINHIKTYCTPHNFTYSMNSDNEWGEYTPNTPVWATTNYWMDHNLVPDSSSPSWALIDDGNTVQLSPGIHIHIDSHGNRTATFDGLGFIDHYYSPGPSPNDEITCYIVATTNPYPSSSNNIALFNLACDPSSQPDALPMHFIDLFYCYQNQIGIYYDIAWHSDKRLITPESGRYYHIFVFKGKSISSTTDITLIVDGTLDSFQVNGGNDFYKSRFPWRTSWSTADIPWDIKLIAFLDVAESDEVIANNVNLLRMIYK